MEETLQSILKEQMHEQGLSASKLGQRTDIAERYISAFLEGDTSRLPASPYVRGYLLKIAEVLELDKNELWERYQKEVAVIKSSGSQDVMPGNRFELKKISKPWTITIAVVILFTVFGALNFNQLVGKPRLDIITPKPETLITSSSRIELRGVIHTEGNLFISGEEISIAPNGDFIYLYSLEPGLNVIEFRAKKLLGRETIILKQVIYQPEIQTIPSF